MLDAAHLQHLSIHLDETGKKIIASFAPEGATEAITLADFKQAINEAGFGEYQLHHPALQEATSKYNSGKAFKLVVGEAVDGQFTIDIDGSQIAAYLTCTLPTGGSPVQMESVIQEAQKKGIAPQLNLSAIESAIKNGGEDILAGQTTIRLRHAYGELGQFGVGQYWSPFMDIGVFPNSVEYWGPNGMAFFLNVQFRYMPLKGDTRLTFALERPGASADAGEYSNRVELQGVKARFPVPDLSAEYRSAHDWGYVELSGIVRYIKWEDLIVNEEEEDISGDAIGWGLNLSSNLKLGKDNLLRLSVLYGAGVQNI